MLRRDLVVVFDLDGVLVPIKSSWEYLHSYFGIQDDVYRMVNVELFYKGIITYDEWMRRDLKLLTSKGCIERDEVLKAFNALTLNDGAEELCSYLHNLGVKTAIVSGGIDMLAELVGSKLGITTIYANKLLFDNNGCLLPYGIEVVNPLRKDEVIYKLTALFGIPSKHFMYVGDTDWDVSAFKVVGYPVIFNCSSCSKLLNELKISHYYEINNLRELVNIISKLIDS